MKKKKLKALVAELQEQVANQEEELSYLRRGFSEKPTYREPTEQEAWQEIMSDPDLRRDLAGL